MAPIQLDKNSFLLEQNEEQIPLGNYLFKRLLSIGIKSIFGVPGDFNLPLLEHLYDTEYVSKLRWIGGCNELNSAYSADGYSRYTDNISCVITTYGVGELSAINAISGSFAENVKVLHIVGIPSLKILNDPIKKNQNLHHLVPSMNNFNINKPNHFIYHDMVNDKISCSTNILNDINTATDIIDNCIMDIYKYSRPGYLFIPSDLSDMLVSNKNLLLKKTITLNDSLSLDNSNLFQSHINDLTKLILTKLYQSKSPTIIGDLLIDRFNGNKQINKLIDMTQIRNYSTPLSKSIIDESNLNYMGLYNGCQSNSHVIKNFENSDLYLHFGIFSNEVNNGYYTYNYNSKNSIVFQLNHEYLNIIEYKDGKEISNVLHKDVHFIHILNNMLKDIDTSKLQFNYPEKIKPISVKDTIEDNDSLITQESLGKMFPKFLNPGDVLVADTGAFQFSIRDFILPTQFKYITQGFYLAIGAALPIALGVGTAMQDYPLNHITDKKNLHNYQPRLILCEGDGAAQMTIQELSTMIREKISINIFLWNNDGYTIERAIMGPTRSYNDIAAWDWCALLNAFGDVNNKTTRSSKLSSNKELFDKLKTLQDKDNNKSIEFIEVLLGKVDYPPQLQQMIDDINAKAKK